MMMKLNDFFNITTTAGQTTTGNTTTGKDEKPDPL
jgi:hypothetical protein